ncbi:MAG: calx-beta domain protein [Microcystis aeruginosa W13-18]|jgi:Ca2+-binding RTX toxin-like protein|nr:calx-beta domain protein [Microcystis aeruginosa W13-18]NCR38017.1 calx-beta domain protein [Microcystis aeruginosa S11-05]NCR51440.1 calx-beta domain protein [Microcystis aeruginosa S11-01]
MNYPIVVTAGGTIVSGENGYLTTSRTAETVVTFDIGFTSLPSYTGGSIRQGDQVGFWLAPSNNTSNYLSVDPFSGTPSVISAPNGTLWKYFGLYWGSIDDYNSIEFWKDNTRIAYYSGSDIATLLNLRGGYINFDVNNNDGYFNKIILTSTQQAFESDNHAFISEFPSITLTVASTSVTEDGTTNLVYTFTRTGSTTSALTANYTVGGTATNGTDYTSIPTSVTFAANSSTATVTVDPTADTTVESNETVALTLATGTGYTVGTTTAVTGTITNDDTSVTLAVSPTSVTEDGTANLVYTFTRSGVTTNALTVNYTIGGTATLNTDYTRTGTTNTVTFAAGSFTATVIVDPTADTTVESNETVALTLATGTGYTVGTTTAVTGTINNDDVTLPSITLAVSPSSVTEDGTANLVYTFTRSGVTTNALTVNYTLGGTATLNTDYTRTGTTNTVTFAASSSTATVIVDPTADTTVESNETVALTLATGTGYTVGTPNTVTGTITNDDVTLPSITLSLNYSGISESSPGNFVYTFTRTGVTTNALTVNYNIAGTASATDYTGATPGNGKTITFNPGSTTTSITIDPTADTVVEPNETISLQLAAGTGYSIGTTAAQIATIINDDSTRRHVGTNGKDVLLGTNANDYLIGGAGDDILTGGTGGDIFYFASSNLGNDAITDFTPGQDFIQVSRQGFGGGLIAGDTITQVQFLIGSSATNASQRFIYNSTSGALLFDVDGNGIQSAQQIATLNTGLALTYEDIFVS